ncbi:hypothetical protein CEXT_253131 [Caerostris extrusa]|uniref:Uncharacterized protein n=1 Tax=Caerostris extrusa TaxID=172846 RepID=A0AAV4WVW7_CAEEX|nr:hypothetical protein CEXT_253131 [Caerostris extrusa]
MREMPAVLLLSHANAFELGSELVKGETRLIRQMQLSSIKERTSHDCVMDAGINSQSPPLSPPPAPLKEPDNVHSQKKTTGKKKKYLLQAVALARDDSSLVDICRFPSYQD